MKGDARRHSRHIYDIFKLLPMVSLDDDFGKLVKEVREIRAKSVSIGHSAQPGVNVPSVLVEIMDKEIYRNDYESVTSRILKEQISYDKAIEAVCRIAESGLFLE